MRTLIINSAPSTSITSALHSALLCSSHQHNNTTTQQHIHGSHENTGPVAVQTAHQEQQAVHRLQFQRVLPPQVQNRVQAEHVAGRPGQDQRAGHPRHGRARRLEETSHRLPTVHFRQDRRRALKQQEALICAPFQDNFKCIYKPIYNLF